MTDVWAPLRAIYTKEGGQTGHSRAHVSRLTVAVVRLRGRSPPCADRRRGAIVDTSGSSRTFSFPTEGTTLMAAPIALSVTQPIATRVWATAMSYVVIYGVSFAFLAPPATQLAMQGLSAYDARTATFTLLLMAALTVTFGAGTFAYSVGWRVESDLRRRRTTERRALIEFASFGAVLSLATAGIYVAIVSTAGGITSSLIGAAALALVLPGLAAALFTRSVVDHVAAAKRELVATSLSALAVIVLTNYLIVGSLPALADLPQLLGVK